MLLTAGRVAAEHERVAEPRDAPGHEQSGEGAAHRGGDDLCFFDSSSGGGRCYALARRAGGGGTAGVVALVEQRDNGDARGHVAHLEGRVEEDFGRGG